MKNFFARVWQVIKIIYYFLAGVTNNVSDEVQAFASSLIIISGVHLAVFFGLLYWGEEIPLYLFAFYSAIIAIIAHKVPDLLISLIQTTIAIDFVVKIGDKIKALLRPMITISISAAFISCYVAIMGLDSIEFRDILIGTAVFLFFLLFSFLFRYRTLIFEFSMAVIVIIMLIFNYIFPVQAQSVTDWAGRVSFGWATDLNNTDTEEKMVLIPDSTVLYNDDFENIGNAKGDIKAMILDTKSKGKSEKFYKLMVPNKDGAYVNGETYYVPIRFIKDVKGVEQNQKTTETKQINNPSTFSSYRFSKAGDTETLMFKSGQTINSSKVSPPVRNNSFRVRSTVACLVYGMRVEANQWVTYDQWTPGPVEITGLDKAGKIVLEVL